MTFEDYLLALGILLGVAILVYLLSRIWAKNRLLVSKRATTSDPEADQYYYLPGYGINLQVTATVLLFRDRLKRVKRTDLISLSAQPEVVLQADTRNLVTLHYISDPFSSDELKITTSAKSLLQNISSVATDKIATIVNVIVQAPKETLDELGSSVEAIKSDDDVKPDARPVVITRVFKLSPEELAKGEVSIDMVDGEAGVNLQFTLKNNNFSGEVSIPDEFNGILSRPMSNQAWEVRQASGDNGADETSTPPLSSFTCYAPDYSRIIKVPVRRAMFSRRQQLPGFSDGLLIENSISKHSEAEGLASIPLNILKAIVSIPAQLFQFRIIHNKLETEHAKSLLELKKAQEANNKHAAEQLSKLTGEVESLTAAVDQITEVAPAVPQEPVPALGKLPPKSRRPARSFFETGVLESTAGADMLEKTTAAPAAVGFKEPCFWNEKFSGSISDYGNTLNGIQNCVPAAAAHMITFWTSNAKGRATVLSSKTVLEAYIKESGYNPARPATDVGCSILNFLSNWQFNGIGGNKIRTFARFKEQQREEIKQAIFLFGPCIIGLDMPHTARSQTNGAWKYVDGPGSEPGSWGFRGGGHAVAAIGYDAEGLLVISWGSPIKMDWKFYEEYNDESYVALSDDWLTTANTSPSPSNKTLEMLQATISKLSPSNPF